MIKKLIFATTLVIANICFYSSANAAGECVKVVTHEWQGENNKADPAVQTAMDDTIRTFTTNEGLVRVDNGFTPQPLLATSWESNADATEWTFNLRKGVKFHDGSDLDAGDVVWSYKRLLDPAVQSNSFAILDPFLKDIVAVDDHTVKFIAKAPTVELPLQIKTKGSGIVPNGSTTEMLQVNPMGTGPYQLVNFKPGASKDTFIKHNDYWQAGLPKHDCMELIPILDTAARTASLLAGQVDLIPVLDPASAKSLKGNPSVNLDISSGGTVMTISMFADTAPFDDLRVRQAMKLVVDRQAVVDTALFGFGEAGNDNPIAPSMPYSYKKDLIAQDCDKAKSLIAEAGYADGLSIDLNTGEAFPGMVNVAEAYAEMAKCGNINVNIIKNPAEGYWDNIWMKQPLITSSWGGRPPFAAFSIAYMQDSKYPETHWANQAFDDLVTQASSTPDPVARDNLWKEAQQILTEDGGVIVPAFLSTVSAMRSNCSGYTAESNVVQFFAADFNCSDK